MGSVELRRDIKAAPAQIVPDPPLSQTNIHLQQIQSEVEQLFLDNATISEIWPGGDDKKISTLPMLSFFYIRFGISVMLAILDCSSEFRMKINIA